MPNTKAKLLIVDDESTIRLSMSHTLTEVGFCVRSAEDGFSALAELRKEIPDILLSDLNMPGMSGFELLAVVRRRFPAIQTIAMSGSFCGDEVPSGVAADAFYPKGSSVGCLLRIIAALPLPERMLPNHPSRALATPALIWVELQGNDNSGAAWVTIPCPECLRTFSYPLGSSLGPIFETNCVHCHSSIHYAVVHPAERDPGQAFCWRPAQGNQQPEIVPQPYR
jgi:CheY-like chemotaxis protein